MSPSGIYVPADGEYRALGLSSRRMCWVVAIIGLLTSWAGFGVALLVWGLVAENMIVKHQKKLAMAEKTNGQRTGGFPVF
jgi:D-alanyl-lipoteichoic acid acyltransferase DltB (MBOAT superfamily)